MIWFLASFFLVAVFSTPGDLSMYSTALPRERAEAVVKDFSRFLRVERAFDASDKLRAEGSAALEGFAIRFGDALARPETTKAELLSLRDELDQALRLAWEHQLEVRARLRRELSPDEWRAIFPAPR